MKGKSIIDMNKVFEASTESNGVHGSANVAPPSSQPQQQAVNAVSGSGEGVKRKRGRPRKLNVGGNSMVPMGSAVASPPVVMTGVASPPVVVSCVASPPVVVSCVTPLRMVMSGVAPPPLMSGVAPPPLMIGVAPPPVMGGVAPQAGFTLSQSNENSANSTQGRGRGRPRGSRNRQMLASQGDVFAETAAESFTPHLITVFPGEDVIGKIMSLSEREPRGLCVLSLNGKIAKPSIRQLIIPPKNVATYSVPSNVATYKGQYEILTLTASLPMPDIDGVRSMNGGFTVSLAGPDGNVFGGPVVGPLIAASVIPIVVGSFDPGLQRVNRRRRVQASRVPPIQSVQASTVTNASHVLPSCFQVHGVGPSRAAEQMPSPDINMAAPDE